MKHIPEMEIIQKLENVSDVCYGGSLSGLPRITREEAAAIIAHWADTNDLLLPYTKEIDSDS